MRNIKLRIDGPYCAPAEDVFGSEVAVLVAAGIGVMVGPNPWILTYRMSETDWEAIR